MKKLLAVLASTAFVGTVFAQTAVPASATQTGNGMPKDHVTSTKDKADVHATPHKSAPKATHQKVSKTSKTGTATPDKPKAEAKADADKVKPTAMTSATPSAQPGAAKPASVDKTKTQ